VGEEASKRTNTDSARLHHSCEETSWALATAKTPPKPDRVYPIPYRTVPSRSSVLYLREMIFAAVLASPPLASCDGNDVPCHVSSYSSFRVTREVWLLSS
jgi:hypothetical protein